MVGGGEGLVGEVEERQRGVGGGGEAVRGWWVCSLHWSFICACYVCVYMLCLCMCM